MAIQENSAGQIDPTHMLRVYDHNEKNPTALLEFLLEQRHKLKLPSMCPWNWVPKIMFSGEVERVMARISVWVMGAGRDRSGGRDREGQGESD